MSVEKVLVPDLGDFDEVDVIEVLVAAGDEVDQEESLITLESDKATLDVPSPLAGVVHEVKMRAGDKVGAGDLILTLEPAAEAADDAAAPEPEPESESEEAETKFEGATAQETPPAPETEPVEAQVAATRPPESPAAVPAVRSEAPAEAPEPPIRSLDSEARRSAHAGPAVRRFARELGVDLGRVRGSGRKGRILKDDVQAFVKRALSAPAASGGPGLPPMPAIDFSLFGEIDRQPLSRIQRISGPNLQRSWLNVPHVTQHDEADITELERFRRKHSPEAKAQGFSLTPLAFVMKACVPMLREFPALNSSLDPDGEHLIFKRYIHLGFAVDTPGGLMVPVIRDVDQKGIFEIARELREISGRAREGKARLDELKGASFTITSLGGIGGTAFTPIVNAPEVAILGLSKNRIQPVWDGGRFEPRTVLPLSLSYDHRVVDGAMAVRATTFLAKTLADIRTMLL